MNCFLLTNSVRSVVALHKVSKMPVVMLGEVTKEIENLISDFDLTLYAFPPASRHFFFGFGVDGYAIGKKMFYVPAGSETRKCAGVDFGWQEFFGTITGALNPVKDWSDKQINDYADTHDLNKYVSHYGN